MQISASNLVASQSQALLRPRGTVASFEPIAFKQTPAAAKSPAGEVPSPAAQPAASGATTVTGGATTTASYGGYVRPGTNLDIKI